jgi:hypothetical protein
MKDRIGVFDDRKIVVLTPENSEESEYLESENVLKIMKDYGVGPWELVTAEVFYKRLKRPNPNVIPVIMKTGSFYGTYATVKSMKEIE